MAPDVAPDGELISRYRSLVKESARVPRAQGAMFSLTPPGAKTPEGKMFEMVGLIINLTACTASLAFPPSAWLAITVCGSTFLTAVTTFTGEDLNIFGVEVPLIVIDAVGCLAGEPISCVSTVVDAIVIVVDAFYDNEEANEEVEDSEAAMSED